MLALADRDGVVYGSIPGLAASAHISLGECEDALKRFQEPDKYSSTKDFDGRRIEETIGGWRLLNYQKYRELQSIEDVREKARIRVQNHRERKRLLKDVTLPSRNVTPVTPGNASNDIASASASASASPSLHTAVKGSKVLDSLKDSKGLSFTKTDTPTDLHELQYATRLMEEISMPLTPNNQRQVAAGIKAEAKTHGGLAGAYEFVLTATRAQIASSGSVDGWWFAEAKWRRKPKEKPARPKQANPAETVKRQEAEYIAERDAEDVKK